MMRHTRERITPMYVIAERTTAIGVGSGIGLRS